MEAQFNIQDASQARIMILMRGLPSCGKTYTSRKLARAGGAHIEFDQFFYTQMGADPNSYDWSEQELSNARNWNLERIKAAVDEGVSPIIVDSDNTVCGFTKQYVVYAVERGYEIQFKDPESPWWRTIRQLLDNRESNARELRAWAGILTTLSESMHRVPLQAILQRIERWKSDITCEDILAAE